MTVDFSRAAPAADAHTSTDLKVHTDVSGGNASETSRRSPRRDPVIMSAVAWRDTA
jgi:hypothetical protein